MNFTTTKLVLTRKNEETFKQIFKKCFTESWRASIPFPKDPIIAALNSRGDVVGFCFVHNETPYTMKYGQGSFMYNLCVDPQYRKQGVASNIIKHVTREYPKCYSHSLVESNHNMMTRNGWKRIGVWREKFIEYVFGVEVEKEIEVPLELNTKNYDPDENVIYLS
jgi:ribosomal protein S18 acetylase RimI-like enzyme